MFWNWELAYVPTRRYKTAAMTAVAKVTAAQMPAVTARASANAARALHVHQDPIECCTIEEAPILDHGANLLSVPDVIKRISAQQH
jgi:hypothetical protein